VLASQGALAQPQVISAEFGDPTDRYNHAVLGPNAEWGTLVIRLDTCPTCAVLKSQGVVVKLPENRVFEDLVPRLIDLDGDMAPEVVVIESDNDKGARLAIYGSNGFITATPFIGTSFRWLAPIGAADLNGDGLTEIAYIDRPHLAKTLRVWQYNKGTLNEIAAMKGLTNHRIGEAFITSGIRDCGQGSELITADATWRNIIATRMRKDGSLTARPIGKFRGKASVDAAIACK